jgi:Fe-S cluster assembly scaffold protein SufB
MNEPPDHTAEFNARINSENMGQFERTLIIADEGASVNYVEGCTAPVFRKYACNGVSNLTFLGT